LKKTLKRVQQKKDAAAIRARAFVNPENKKHEQ
jgi:hypothetical protein